MSHKLKITEAKKKTDVASKQSASAVRHTKEQAPGKESTPRPGKSATGAIQSTSAINMAAANEAQKQKEAFEKATKLFQVRNFSEALAHFEAAVIGPSIEIAHVARLHVKMCQQRIQKPSSVMNSPEDCYNYAITLINQRQLDEAEKQLKIALEANDTADHFHYAMALCQGLKGNYEGAAKHLGRAMEIMPNTRAIARNDPDFREILQSAPLRALYAATKPV